MTILLTGVAGFIGHHVAEALLARGERVIGIDDLNPYYDVILKEARLARLARWRGFSFRRADVADAEAMLAFAEAEPGIGCIIHLAAQAGVRHSLVDPLAYARSNMLGHLVVLELARRLPRLRHFVYASSSSVYGANPCPFREEDRVDRPTSLYAASKRAGELMSESYRHLFGLSQTGLRFFTVYGPWGRPDMAYYAFALAIARGEPVTVYEGGRLRRDFTYIDDVVTGVLGCLDHPPAAGEHRLVNLGNHRSESVADLIAHLERGLGRRAVLVEAPRPPADVEATFADIGRAQAICGFAPRTTLAEGIGRFLAWFRAWHGV